MKDVYNTVHILWTLCPHAIYPNIIIALYTVDILEIKTNATMERSF